jgi:hypothetical protein
MKNTMPRNVLIAIGVIILAILAFFGYKYFLYMKGVGALPPEGSVVSFVEGGILERYALEGNGLVLKREAARNDGIVVTESVASGKAGESVVLALVPGKPGVLAGVAAADGTILALVSGGTNKADLLVRSDGIAVFSSSPVPPPSAPVDTGDDTDAAGPDEVGSATGPGVPSAPVAAAPLSATYPQLVSVNTATRAIRSLGLGYSPRLLADGMVVALAPEGIVKINPATGARTVVLPLTDTGAAFGALSPSGTIAAIPAPDNVSVRFYRLAPDAAGTPEDLGYLERDGSDMRTGFADDTHVFIRISTRVARYYALPGTLPVATPVAVLSITQ